MPATSPGATGDLRAYVTGLVLALILTAIPFGLVFYRLLPAGPSLVLIAIAAVVQFLVHFRYFLHIDLKRTHPDWLAMLALAAVLLVIMVGGTIWVMIDLNMRMM
jgi:cytochrome o ubiquinol oxidase subunit IV